MRPLLTLTALLITSQAFAGDLVLQKAGGAGPADAIRQADAQSDSWDEAVTQALLAAYDTNSSGDIESKKELKLIDCETWLAIDAGVQAKWDGTGARAIYGFAKGYGWVGYAWGFNEKLRKSADKAMKKCGMDD